MVDHQLGQLHCRRKVVDAGSKLSEPGELMVTVAVPVAARPASAPAGMVQK
jgi:hypothetical protein